MSSNSNLRSMIEGLRSRLLAAYSRISTVLLPILSQLRSEPLPVLNADRYLRFLRQSAERGAGNLVFSEKIPHSEFREKIKNSDYWSWVQSGDYHYFISRVLFLHHIREYSLFAGHQCVENYFKAYLRFRGEVPKTTHNLISLLEDCRKVAPAHTLFIHSDQAKVVVQRYDPFYELARYPISLVRPGSGYTIWFPSDLKVLDYFVYRMRQIPPAPGNARDIFTSGHYDLHQCQTHFPSFYNLLRTGNLNFGESLDP